MDEVWIIGGGKFGSRAANLLSGKYPEADIILVDSNPDPLQPWKDKIDIVVCDAVAFLTQHLAEAKLPDWIVAAIPIHIAYEWLRLTLGRDFTPLPIPEALSTRLPNPIRGKNGELYTSYAEALCPEDCPEPPGYCPATEKPRPKELYRLLEKLCFNDFQPAVLRSQLLAPGVGGCKALDLLNLRDKILRHDGRFLISTACPCQGVTHAADIRAGN